MSWRQEYEGKLISAEEAAKLVSDGYRVVFTMGREALNCGLALATRKEELKNVKVFLPTPTYDFPWYDAGWEDSFAITIASPTATCQEAIDGHRADFLLIPPIDQLQIQEPPDVLFTEISAPDDNGFCSFGNSLWNKKTQIYKTRGAGNKVVAEVNKNLIRTYGDNFIHVSEIDYFVEHIPAGGAPGMGSLAGRALKEPEPFLKDIAGYASSLIEDGDTLQIGVGRTTEPLIQLGLLNGKHDIGFHSEATPPGVISLVRKGIINGKRKTMYPEKVVVTSIGGSTREEMEWVHMNPLFWLVSYAHLEDLRVIAAHDNMTAINNALMVDFYGQIAAESIGTRMLAAPGGQPPFVFGAVQAKNGKSITVLPSSSKGKSRIVPTLPQGTLVTIPREFSDYVITEYGIASLRGKSLRQRADELIAIAHPDFRPELRKEAKALFW